MKKNFILCVLMIQGFVFCGQGKGRGQGEIIFNGNQFSAINQALSDQVSRWIQQHELALRLEGVYIQTPRLQCEADFGLDAKGQIYYKFKLINRANQEGTIPETCYVLCFMYHQLNKIFAQEPLKSYWDLIKPKIEHNLQPQKAMAVGNKGSAE